MKTVGIFEAKNRLSELVSDVERGETVVLTRHGKPVAEIVPASASEKKAEAEEAMKWILSRRWKLPKGLSIKDAIEKGRRF